MEARTLKRKFPAVRFLSVFLCVFMLFSYLSCRVPTKAASAPLLYINDTVFASWQETPPQTVNGVVYIPITMFMELDNVYYFSSPKNGSFYLQNEITEEYLSFSLNTSDAYNGKNMIKIDIKVFNNTIYLPALETANHLGLYVEMNTDKTIVRLSDASARMSFSNLVALYTPAPPVVDPSPETPPVTVTPPDVSTDPPVTGNDQPTEQTPIPQQPDTPVVHPCSVYLTFANPSGETLPSLLIALERQNIDVTFAFSSDYILKNSDSILDIFARGYTIAINANGNYSDALQLHEDVELANLLLQRITKQKTRVVTLPSDIGNGVINSLKTKGYVPHRINIVPQKNIYSSKKLAESVISKFNSYPKACVSMTSDITGISALYEIGKHIDSYDIINSYPLDETVR